MIKHSPITNINKIIDHYSEKDGVEIRYVCTTDLHESDLPIDIFYRTTPHPKFNNRYFGIYFRNNMAMICNADKVEELTFGMVANGNGELEYSSSHYDYKSFKNGNMIDGGRVYIRYSGPLSTYVVRDGEIISQ